jgi:Mg-chelatase subunit ChlD
MREGQSPGSIPGMREGQSPGSIPGMREGQSPITSVGMREGQSPGSIIFHNQATPLYHTMSSDDEKFGILRLKIEPESEPAPRKIAIVFTIDTSASMTDYCSDNKRKIDHATQTLIGIMHYLAENSKKSGGQGPEVTVAVLSFSSKVKHIVEFTRITSENLTKIVRKIHCIHSQDSTNIETAIKEADAMLIEYGNQNPDTKLYHIQLTDGEITDGIKDHDKLAEIVNPDYTNIFVGFGKYHDDRLLCRLSENPRNDYRFIDKLEYSKIVYGEIMYNILYHKYDKIKIEIQGGAEIYDWRTNTWGSHLVIRNIPYDCDRIFQLRCAGTVDPAFDVEAIIWTDESQSPHQIYCYPELINAETNELEVHDLTQYSFRQRTQELLYEVRELMKRGGDTTEDDPDTTEKNILYTKCQEFMRTIKEYIGRDVDGETRLLRLLQDDIYIVLKTLYRRNAHMWCATRQISLGSEHSYQPTAFEDDLGPVTLSVAPKMRRQQTQVFYTTQDSPIYTFPLFDHPLNTPDMEPKFEYELSQNYEITTMSPTLARTIDAIAGDDITPGL